MPLRITVVPASTQAGRRTIETLLQDKSQPIVNAIYRDPVNAPEEFLKHSQIQLKYGDVSSESSLDFGDSDAVFYIPPPTYDGTDSTEFAKKNAFNIHQALRRANSVKRLVILSAIGAQHETGIGILSINHVTDKVLQHSAPEVVIARAGWFQENWATAFETLNTSRPFFHSIFTPIDYKIAMISTSDIGKMCAQTLLETRQVLPSHPYTFTLHGPRGYSAFDVKVALETVASKSIEIDAVEPDRLVTFFSNHVPERYARELAEMTVACLPGGILASEMSNERGVIRGSTELVDTLRKFAVGDVSKAKSGAF